MKKNKMGVEIKRLSRVILGYGFIDIVENFQASMILYQG